MAHFSERLKRTAWGLAFIALGTGDIATNAAMPFVVSPLSAQDVLTVILFMALGMVYFAFGAWILNASGNWRNARTVSLWGAAAAWALAGGLLMLIEGGAPGTHDPLYRYIYGGTPADITYVIGTVATILLALAMTVIGFGKMRVAWRGTNPAEKNEAPK